MHDRPSFRTEPPTVSRTQRTRYLTLVPQLPAHDPEIPAPDESFIRALAAQAFEVVEGARPVAQLGPRVSFGAARSLAEQRTAQREKREVYRDRRVCLPSPGPVRICRVLSNCAEATVVIHTDRRAYAVALRLEWVHGRWRACELYVM